MTCLKFGLTYSKKPTKKKKNELRSKFLQDTLPNGLAKLEDQLINRGGQYFVGNNLTWADFHVYTFLDMIRRNHSEELDNIPKIKNLMERIEELPNISKWLKSRPESDFDGVLMNI